MPKQKLEGILSRSLKLVPHLYSFKLHNNPLAHQKTPADFLAHSKYGNTYYIECKECKLKDGKSAFSFDRLTQEADLIVLEDFAPHVQSFIMILFRETTLKKSFCFLIPIYKYLEFKRMIPKKSANIKDFNKHLQMYLLEPQVGSIYKLNSLK